MKISIVSFIVILTIAFTSCQNFEEADAIDSSNDLVLKSAEIAINDLMVESVVEEANYEAEFFAESELFLRQLAHIKGMKNLMGGKDGMRYLAGNCPNVSIDTANTSYPMVITLDYGDGTELNNGRIISGTIIIEISAERGTDGATRTISYVECVIDSVGINGVCTQTFNGDNENTRIVTTTSDVTFVMADGTVLDRIGNHVREWLEGIDTPMEHNDDMIQITGSVDMVSSSGESWNRNIIEPLLRLGDCRYNVQGTVQISQNNEVISLLDFGEGECDNIALLTVDDETIEIELGGRKPEAKMNTRKNRK